MTTMTADTEFSQLEDMAWVRKLPERLEPFRDMLLANLVMLAEIPAPTFGEQERIAFLEQRFTECGLQNCYTDDTGNCLGLLPGADGSKTIVLAAHADTPFAENQDHTCTVEAGVIRGCGVGDNSLGLAVLATLPTILERLNIYLQHDVLFIGCSGSLDHGNLSGLRFFLNNCDLPLAAAVSLEGARLGRLQFRSVASMGGMISCQVNRKISQISAIDILCRIISRLRELEPEKGSDSSLVLGAISGGASYKVPARNAFLKLQVRCESDEEVVAMADRIDEVLDEIADPDGVSAHLEVIAKTRAGGLEYNHPLVKYTRTIMKALDIHPRDSIYSPTISGYVEKGVPAVCVGISDGDNVNYPDEFVEIDPVTKGVAQLVGILRGIDGGFCA